MSADAKIHPSEMFAINVQALYVLFVKKERESFPPLRPTQVLWVIWNVTLHIQMKHKSKKVTKAKEAKQTGR